MTNQANSPSIFAEAFRTELREIIREAVQEAIGQNGPRSQKSTEAPKPYLTIKEAADMARLSPSAIRLYVSKRQLKPYRVGRRVIIKRTDLEKFVESHPIEILSD